MNRIKITWLSFLGGVVLSACQPSSRFPDKLEAIDVFDVVIRNGTIIDGTGAAPYLSDIIVQADTIAFIGKLSESDSAYLTINAFGKVVTPGFIDTHAHGDPLKTPEFFNFVAQGVTTICLGQDGSSDAIGQFAEWQSLVDSIQPSVNIVPFTGHGSLRMSVKAPFEPRLSDEDMAIMTSELQNQLALGSFGLTMGLEYVPGRYSSEAELQALAKLTGSYNGVLMAHIRNEDNDELENSLGEFLGLGKWAPVNVSHLKSVYGAGKERGIEILSILSSYKELGYQVSADVYPYTASFTGIGIMFPEWALPPANFNQVKRERRKELEEFLRAKIAQRNGPQATLFGTPPFAGKTLADLEKEMNKPFEAILIDDIGPRGASAAYFVMDETLQSTLLQSDFVVLSSDGSPGMRHPRGYGSFAKMIETYTVAKQYFSLEHIVHKMSGQTAEMLGLEYRGLLKVGYKADVTVFDPTAVKAKADFEHPHHLAVGFDWVLVNGKSARLNGEFSEQRNGLLLRRN